MGAYLENYGTYIRSHTLKHWQALWQVVHIHTNTHTHAHARVSAHTHTHTNAHKTHVHMHNIHMHMYEHTNTRTPHAHAQRYIHTCIHTHMHTYIRTYTHGMIKTMVQMTCMITANSYLLLISHMPNTTKHTHNSCSEQRYLYIQCSYNSTSWVEHSLLLEWVITHRISGWQLPDTDPDRSGDNIRKQ